MTHYEPEILDEDEDNGTMPQSLAALTKEIVGHRIVKAEREPATGRYSWNTGEALVLTLDDGRRVALIEEDDCCAFTHVESFLMQPENVEHVITGVGTTDGFTRWHIYADLGDVMELRVGWSCGNPFYYGYGFEITVQDAPEAVEA